MTGKVLYCFAHPDDESFTCGGTIARFASMGRYQALYCATRGEAGKTGNPPVCTHEELGDRRALELENAARILGLNEVILRDHGDGRLHERRDELKADIRSVLDRIRPDVVITFPPSGISGHRDHQVIQQVTLDAVRETSFPTKLYYIVIPESISHFCPPNVIRTPDEYISMTVDVTLFQNVIAEALRAHRSQNISVERVFPGVLQGDFSRLRTHEYYQFVMQTDA
ncbi:PIG-L deacetylase family protein [Staphylospora marina]|uniref:PIG-L deacetylase family protein n=1 Tax=Staphylospora marina TaxID=2490858 RepID=UPI0013DE3345|nr:PIG-L deacetylase family protein [Staphylospora marina]